MCDCKVAIGVSKSLVVVNNSLEGPASDIINQMLLFITRKCNVTYISYSALYPTGEVCFDDGICEDLLRYLQENVFDFIFRPYTINVLNNIGINLTTTVINFKDCVAIYAKNAITRYSSSTPIDSLSEFGFETICIFSCLMALLTLLLITIIIQRTQSSLFQVFWSNFAYFSCQNSLPADCLTQKWVYGFYIISLFLARILLTSNLQTGLIIDKHYINLKNYKDIIEYNYKPFCLQNSACHALMAQSTDRYAKLVANKTKFIESQSFDWVNTYNQIHKIGHVTLEAAATYDTIKKIGCTFAVEEEKKFPLIQVPMAYSLVGYLMSRNSSPKVKDVILKGIYANYEQKTPLTKRGQNQLYNRLGRNPEPSCYNAIDTNREDSETVPLQIHYMTDLLIMYAIGIAIISIIFTFRLVF